MDAAAAALEHLAISFAMDPSFAGQQAKQLAAQCIKASQEWIWYAMRSGFGRETIDGFDAS